MQAFGLPERTLKTMQAVFARYPQVTKVMVYGSRAMGNYRPGSDIDLTMYGDYTDSISYHDLLRIAGELDDSDIPYLFDLSIFDMLDHAKLRDHIERKGKVFYKKTEVSWIISKLGKDCKIFSGNSINAKTKQNLYTNVDGTPYIATKDITYDGAINYFNGINIPEKYKNKFRKARPNCVFICAEGGSAGRKIAFSEKECFFVNKLFCLNAGLNILPKYIYYFLKSEVFQTQFKNALTGLIGGVSLSKIKSFELSYPPLLVQKQIVEKLDAAFANIDKAISATQRNIENAKALFQNYMLHTFNNINADNKKVGDILKLEYGKALSKEERDTEGKYPAYGANGVKSRTNKFLYENPSIIVGRKGSAGEIILTNSKFWALDVSYYVIFDKKSYALDFLYYLLKKLNIPSLAKGIKPGINRNDVYSIDVKIPNLGTQENIAEKLKNIDLKSTGITKTYLNKISEYHNLKSSILNQAFSGELTMDVQYIPSEFTDS